MSARAWRFGGAGALALAVLTAVAAMAYILLPAEQQLGVPGRSFLPSFAANALPLQLEMLFLTAMGVSAMGARLLVVGVVALRPRGHIVAWFGWVGRRLWPRCDTAAPV